MAFDIFIIPIHTPTRQSNRIFVHESMEFSDVNIQFLFRKDVTCVDAVFLQKLSRDKCAQISSVIDLMGIASAKAQNLPQVITSTSKLASSDHRLYVAVSPPRAVSGILKVGHKKLFIRGESGDIREIEPLCVLDFYVHESQQRQGIGLLLFTRMLLHENIKPHRLGYDRPSPKLIGFLSKHYQLSRFTPQPNNFVVFKDFFEDREEDLHGHLQHRSNHEDTRHPHSNPLNHNHHIHHQHGLLGSARTQDRSNSAPVFRDADEPLSTSNSPQTDRYDVRSGPGANRQTRGAHESTYNSISAQYNPPAGRRRAPSSGFDGNLSNSRGLLRLETSSHHELGTPFATTNANAGADTHASSSFHHAAPIAIAGRRASPAPGNIPSQQTAPSSGFVGTHSTSGTQSIGTNRWRSSPDHFASSPGSSSTSFPPILPHPHPEMEPSTNRPFDGAQSTQKPDSRVPSQVAPVTKHSEGLQPRDLLRDMDGSAKFRSSSRHEQDTKVSQISNHHAAQTELFAQTPSSSQNNTSSLGYRRARGIF